MQLLQRAASFYARGNLHAAEVSCRQLLQLHPAQADALHILGLVALRRGDRQDALDHIRKAIAADPNRPQPHNSLGVLLKQTGDAGAAESAFRTAIALQPDYSEALTNLGNVLCEAGRLTEAETMHRRAVELAPRYAEGHNNLATALAGQERWGEAVEECRVAVALEPNNAEFQVNLGYSLSAIKAWEEASRVFQRAVELAPGHADAHANLGIALFRLDRPQEAEAAHRTATKLRPNSAHIWVNLGVAQTDLNQPDAALESCRKALDLEPNFPDAFNCMGFALKQKGDIDGALAVFERAIRLRPDYYKAHNNLGTVLQAQARFDEAFAAFSKSVEIMPEYAEGQSNKGMLHLLFGDLENGWRGYEYGLDMKRGRGRSRYDQFELWQGAAIAGKTILVTNEQGVGDQIMFGSLLPDLVGLGATCLVKLDRRLYPLLRRSIDGLILIPRDGGELSRIEQYPVDFQTPIGSLCRWLRPSVASFPLRSGYLKADPAQVAEFRSRYRRRFGERPLVGISWRGGTGDVAKVRSIPLAAWSSILMQSEFGFVNLQYGDCRADLAAVRQQTGVEVLHDETVDPLTNLDDFAAQTAAMDLVISIDNSTVHMAGALDVPVWAMLPFVPDWRWMLNRTDSPWYPCVRLFRQPKAGDWLTVLATVAAELKKTGGNAVRRAEAFDEPPNGASGGGGY